MNSIHLEQIFANYIEKFEWLNAPPPGNDEVYKWRVAHWFRAKMDEALDAADDDFPKLLHQIKTETFNIIDSYTQPFKGLSKFAEHEPDTVRKMFRDLYADDGGDLSIRQEKIEAFLKKSHELRDRYFPDSYLYNDDFHSVTGYLTLYDPDHNYIYKATHAQDFADCIEFYDVWGSGDHTNLAVYYRMCDWVVQEIFKNDALLKTDASRFEVHSAKPLHPDKNKHILTFDLIYCCSQYGLFHGITFERPTSKEKKLYLERKSKAEDLATQLVKAQEDARLLDEAKEYLASVMSKGMPVISKSFGSKGLGPGTVIENDGENVTVEFSDSGEIKKLGLAASVSGGLLVSDAPDFKEQIKRYIPILKKAHSVQSNVRSAEKALEPYIEYLD